MRAFTRRDSGITLIELMIGLLIASITGAMLATMFVGQDRALRGQRYVADMQDNGRVAMEMLLRDIRNAGFLTPSESSIRIENNCGAANNDLGYDPATALWKVRVASDRMNDGDIVGTSENDRCPNGSDRITLVMKPDLQTVGTCAPIGCLNNNSGLGSVLRVPCDGTTSSSTGNCEVTLDKFFTDGSENCPGGGAPYPATKYVLACNEDDPSQCTTLPITKHSCDRSCPVSGSGGTNAKCIVFNLGSFSGSSWTAIGGDKDGASISGFTFRTYQILDVDNDGSTELVYSDRVHSKLVTPSPAESAQWIVIANNIDDLQFSWSQATAPDTFDRRTVYNFNNSSCTAEDTNPTSGYKCLWDVLDDAGGTMSAVRVTVLARTQKRDHSSGNIAADHRPAIEGNLPAAQPYNPVLAATQGCTTGNYETCTGNGNAQGYRRRVYSEVVALRNLIGFR